MIRLEEKQTLPRTKILEATEDVRGAGLFFVYMQRKTKACSSEIYHIKPLLKIRLGPSQLFQKYLTVKIDSIWTHETGSAFCTSQKNFQPVTIQVYTEHRLLYHCAQETKEVWKRATRLHNLDDFSLTPGDSDGSRLDRQQWGPLP